MRTIEDLRTVLFDTINQVKSGAMDIKKAKVISDLSQVMVNSAKVEVDHARVTGSKGSGFLEAGEPREPLPNGITGIRQHRLQG